MLILIHGREMRTHPIPSLRAQKALCELGRDIAIARKRRQLTQSRLAEAASVHVTTVRRLENGDPGVSLGTLAMVLLVLGEGDLLGEILDVARDDIGLALSVSSLPKRVREPGKRQARNRGGAENPEKETQDYDTGLEAF